MRYLFKIILLIPLVCSNCVLNSSFGTDRFEIKEAVMHDGMKIIAMTKHGEFIASAGKGTERSYTWDGQTVKVDLVPRRKRWHGKLGLYDGGKVKPPHQNVVHVIIEECQINYQSVHDATRRMNAYEGIEELYRDDGLYIRFQKKLNPRNGKYAVDISVFQIMINGKKPLKLPGSQNDRIIVINKYT